MIRAITRRSLVSHCVLLASAGCDPTGAASTNWPATSNASSDVTASSGSEASVAIASNTGSQSASDAPSAETANERTTDSGIHPEGSAPSTTSNESVEASVAASTVDAGSDFNEADASRAVPAVGWAEGTPDVCLFQISGHLSSSIATVGVVDWSTDLAGVTAARIEFRLDDPREGEVNVGSGGPISTTAPQAWLLGLKPARSYTYRIVVEAGEAECSSADQKLVTAEDPEAPKLATTPNQPARHANGFILASLYDGARAFIFDTDGAVVWHHLAPTQSARNHMDWVGEYMWMMKANPSFGASNHGDVRRVRMDGTGEESIGSLEWSHHDFTVLPDGATAYLVGEEGADDRASSLVERSADGTFTTLARLDARLYFGPAEEFHANALHYYARDDSFTVGDLSAGAIIKLNRQGKLQWQVGYGCTDGPESQCAPADMTGNHGHQLLDDGNLLVMALGQTVTNGDPNDIFEFGLLQEGGTFTAPLVWSHQRATPDTAILGDVERLPNGNTLITYSTAGTLHEVDSAGELVWSASLGASTDAVGYADFRETLYGAPQ
jgi:hypothetical protein